MTWEYYASFCLEFLLLLFIEALSGFRGTNAYLSIQEWRKEIGDTWASYQQWLEYYQSMINMGLTEDYDGCVQAQMMLSKIEDHLRELEEIQ